MNNIIERTWQQNGLVFVEDLRGTAFTYEDKGHTFIIAGKDSDGNDFALAGTVAGSFIRPDGTTTAMNGSITDGKVQITLSAECYGVTGRGALTIFLTSNGQKTAIYSCIVSVKSSSTNTVSPGVTANVVDLVNRIDTAVASIPATYTALMASIAPDYSSTATYTAGDYVWYNGNLYRAVQDITTAETWTSAHWMQVVLGNEVDNLRGTLNQSVDSIVYYNSILAPYLYKKNTYIDNSGVETAKNGYNIYKIPVNPNDVIFVSQNGGSTKFWNNLIDDVVFKIEFEDGSYDAISGTNVGNGYRLGALKMALAHIPANGKYFIVTSYAEYAKYVNVAINTPFKGLNADAVSKYQSVITIDETNSFVGTGYKRGSVFAFLSGDNIAYTLKVKSGDKLYFSEKLPNLSYYAAFTASDKTVTNVNVSPFVVPSDGMVNIFGKVNYDPVCTYYPADSIELDYSKIKNHPVIPTPGVDTNYYDGLSGVAFGTSLTYRAQTTGGYLQYLPGLSGITFDNQGLGSSTILPSGSLPQMMPKITGYTGYSGKRICILEGFVNDFYYNGEHLGTWKDTEQTTVCGCVRYALNYIITQNPNLTVFMVMDHYGKGITAANAVNSAGQTQFEFYQEIEKVALSMGVRVIREYELSEISQLTPQYLLDNIHLNALGAEQSAKAIWSGMKGTYPNIIENT